ncbi:MAG: hypothetical protein KKE20_00825 [Nanoarchaeota archaeon]|nr:hypothetical protein [Nanoarchaeota archaeon]
MTLDIKKQRETPLLSRNRVTCMVEYQGATPSRLEFRKMVAAQLKAPEDLIIIKHIYSRFGQTQAKVIVHVYKDKKDMEKIEEPYLLKKHQKKASGKEEKPAEAEAPAE